MSDLCLHRQLSMLVQVFLFSHHFNLKFYRLEYADDELLFFYYYEYTGYLGLGYLGTVYPETRYLGTGRF